MSYDYWKNHTVEEHEAKLREINQRYIEGKLSRQDVENEISRLLGEDNLSFKLQNRFLQAVNGELSAKGKERIGSKQYFNKCEEIENEKIASEFPFAFFQECTVEEIETLDPTIISPMSLMSIIISALRAYVDSEQEDDPKCEALHKIYLELKNALCAEIPFPEGDGFLDYFEGREGKLLVSQLKQLGKQCPKCSSTHIQKYGLKKFHCVDCGGYWRVK
ncbi:MAG: hypothetical protein ABSA75_04325 [Candidatus Bathyarchaeia archaeon]|jgi:hypothetical protein